MGRGILRIIRFDDTYIRDPRQTIGNGEFHLPSNLIESTIESPVYLKDWSMSDREDINVMHLCAALS
jgi:hypothetical protein